MLQLVSGNGPVNTLVGQKCEYSELYLTKFLYYNATDFTLLNA